MTSLQNVFACSNMKINPGQSLDALRNYYKA